MRKSVLQPIALKRKIKSLVKVGNVVSVHIDYGDMCCCYKVKVSSVRLRRGEFSGDYKYRHRELSAAMGVGGFRTNEITKLKLLKSKNL